MLEINSKCSCGHMYQFLPEVHDVLEGIYWFNCACGSTRTFIPELTKRRLEMKKKEQVRDNRKAEVKRQNEWVKNTYGITTRNKDREKLGEEIDKNKNNFTDTYKEL